jgi:tetratricopeptide (TPR) repeat protein
MEIRQKEVTVKAKLKSKVGGNKIKIMNSLQTIYLIFFTLINHSPDNVVLYGEPVIISANISYSDNYINEYLESEMKILHDQLLDSIITKEEYDRCLKEMQEIQSDSSTYLIKDDQPWKVKMQMQLYNDSLKTWSAVPWEVHFMSIIPENFPLELGSGYDYIFQFGIDPEDLEDIPVGKYTLRFTTDVQKGDSTYVIFSEDAIMEVSGEYADPAEYNTIYKHVTYYTKRGLFEKAMEFADQLLAGNTNNVGGLTLKGNIYREMEDYDAALEYYFRAEHEYDKISDYDENKLYIIDQIRNVQNLMNQ